MAKAKNLIRLLNAETGVFYIQKKNPKITEKRTARKYDKKLRKHAEFKEAKIKG